MKILFISPLPPWPLFSGGQIRVFHLLKALAKKHQVTLMQYISEDEVMDFSKKLSFCFQIKTIRRQYKPWSFKALIKSLFSTKPLLVNLYDLKEDLSLLIKDNDLIFCETFYLMDKIKDVNKPIILGEQNIEYLAYKRYLDNLSFFKKIFLWLPMKWDLIKMKYWEKKMWRQANKIAVVSQADKEIIKRETKRNDIVIITNGVDAKKLQITKPLPGNKLILFIGEFKWFPNNDAVRWLIKDIFPLIKKELNDASLLIVGRHMPGWLRESSGEGIIIDESVKDIKKAYQKAIVILVPLRSGSGTKYKILEAMASGVPVVTTAVGAEGLGKTSMVIKETDVELAKATVDILINPQKYTEMTKRARKMVEEKFDWEIIGEKLESLIQSL